MKEGWISADQMRTELTAAGSSITDSQIERWRRQGLLPRPEQIGRGQGRGSIVIVPPESAAQALEIQRLYAIREKRDWVGWQLWLRGYQVDNRYWKPAIEQARSDIRQVRQYARNSDRITQSQLPEVEQLKVHVLAIFRNTPVYAPMTQIAAEMLETLLNFGKEIVLGQFSGFSRIGDNEPNSEERSAAIAMIGAAAADRDHIGEQKLNFKGPIESILSNLSKSIGTVSRSRSMAEPSVQARQEFLQILETAADLYRSLSWIFGQSAFGLGVINRIAANPAINLQAAMLLIWSPFRQMTDDILSPTEIEKLHGKTREIAELALQLRAYIDALPGDSPLRNMANLKRHLKRGRTIKIP